MLCPRLRPASTRRGDPGLPAASRRTDDGADGLSRPLRSRSPHDLVHRTRRSRIDLHRSGHSGCKSHTGWDLIDDDAHREALRQANPGEDRVDGGEALPIGLRVRDVDAPGYAADMAANDLVVA